MSIVHNNALNISNLVNSYFDGKCTHIFSIAISDTVFNIWLPRGMKEIRYVSNTPLVISPHFCFERYNFDIYVFQKLSHHDNNYEWMLFADNQHSQPHMTLYQGVIFFCWGGIIFHKGLITDDDIIVWISCLFMSTFFWGTHHDIIKFSYRHLQ